MYCIFYFIDLATPVLKLRIDYKVDIWNSLRPSDAYMRQLTNHHWSRQWLVAWSASSYHLNHCWNIANWPPRNKLQWHFNRNLYIFSQCGNITLIVILKMSHKEVFSLPIGFPKFKLQLYDILAKLRLRMSNLQFLASFTLLITALLFINHALAMAKQSFVRILL